MGVDCTPLLFRISTRRSFGLLAAFSTIVPFAEGAFKLAWIEIALLTIITWLLIARWSNYLAKGLLLSVAIFCLALSLGDLVLRIVLWPKLHISPMHAYSRSLPQLPILGRWDENVAFFGTAYGDLAGARWRRSLREPRPVFFRTDRAGFRNDSSDGTFDMVILGDSVAAGVGTSQEKVFASLLKTRYGQRTYNLSFQGIGPWTEYLNFAIEEPRLQLAARTTLIWALFTGNDLDEDYMRTWDLKELAWSSALDAWRVRYRTFWRRSVVRHLFEGLPNLAAHEESPNSHGDIRVLPGGHKMLFLLSQEVAAKRPRSEIEQHPNYPGLVRTMEEMKTLADQRGVELVIIVLPTKGEVYRWILEQREPTLDDIKPSGFGEVILETCRRFGLRCFDTKPYLTEKAWRLFGESGPLLWWRDDTHPNDFGHEAIATFIGEHILKVAPKEDRGDGNR